MTSRKRMGLFAGAGMGAAVAVALRNRWSKGHREPDPVDPIGTAGTASPMSSTESASLFDVTDTIAEVFPDAAVAPCILTGATDARYFHGVAADVYRFMPFRVTPEVMSLVHGTGERIRAADADAAVAFYRRLISRVAAG